MIRFTYCPNFATAETRETDWDTLAKGLTTFKTYPSKEASVARAAIVGGIRANESKGRADGNIIARTVVTIDYDAPVGTLADIEFALAFNLDCAFVAYSTFRHTPDEPRVRVCVPLSRPVNEAEHTIIARQIVDTLGIGEPDKCSFVMSQLMFLPSRQEGVEPFSLRQDGDAWPVPEVVPGAELSVESYRGKKDDLGDDLNDLIVNQPLDLTPEDIDTLLENYPAEGKDYDEWARVGMALWHQFGGSDAGWQRWVSWSEQSSKHDARQMRVKWRSFDGADRPVTMASIIHLAGGLQRAVEIAPTSSAFRDLIEGVERVATLTDYTAVRDRVRSFKDHQLPADMRSLVAAKLHEVFGKGAGIGLREIKSALKAPGRIKGSGNEDGPAGEIKAPDWLADWVYNEKACTFELLTFRHGIKREAFRARHDREIECEAMETDAADYALRIVKIPTVVDAMYWPGQDRIFETEGQKYLNSYFVSGVRPCESLEKDTDGQSVVRLFMDHVANTIDDPREQRILIDWMAYVIQNPGKRVKWALLLQGIEGNGKSYFFSIMQLILGSRARTVSSTALDSPFNGWAEGSMLVGIEEIRIAGTNKYTILDRMKPLLSNDVIGVTHKGVDERHVPNFTSYMMFTNHADAIPVGDNDRRYCAIFTRQTQQGDLFSQHGGREGAANYFRKLFDESERRADALARFLLNWAISPDFDPNGRAPETAGLRRMRNLNVSEDRDALEEAIEEYACAVIGPDIVDVTYLNNLATMDGKTIPASRPLSHALSDKGYSQVDGRKTKTRKTRKNHYVWYRVGRLTSDQAKKIVTDFHDRVPDEFEAPF